MADAACAVCVDDGHCVMDPAVADRRTQCVVGIHEDELPVRPMTIAGITPKADARILSKDGKGPGSRVLNIPARWGNQAPGFFDAELEFFVISGSIILNGSELRRFSYARLPAGAPVEQITCRSPAVSLLFTSAPVRFIADVTPDELTEPVVGPINTAAIPWEPGSSPGYVRKTIAVIGETGATSSLMGALQWRDAKWHKHPVAEEGFVLEGAWEVTEATRDGIKTFSYRAGGYWYRPAGVPHGGPRTGTNGTALVLLRTSGPPDAEWLDQPEPYPAHLR